MKNVVLHLMRVRSRCCACFYHKLCWLHTSIDASARHWKPIENGMKNEGVKIKVVDIRSSQDVIPNMRGLIIPGKVIL